MTKVAQVNQALARVDPNRARSIAKFETLNQRAREADILSVAERLGARLKKASGEWVGPCPRCGGRDRFAINVRKRIFNCRRCAIGRDTIGMVEHVTGSSFVEAVKFITGESAANTGEEVEKTS